MSTNKLELVNNMSMKDISNFITEHLPIRTTEKDKFGEVFTPIHLIEELLNALPKNVWSNPNLRWLDPAAGVGNFGLLIYFRLMKGLAHKIPDQKSRSEHILKNMLFQIELNSENASKIYHLFGAKNKNIYSGSFLQAGLGSPNEEMFKQFGEKKFDIIIGNPPYQKSMESHEKRGTNAGRQTLWDKFIVAGFSILNKNGYLAFITPNSWRGLGKLGHLWDILKQKSILYLHIYGMQEGIKQFGASTRFDLFVIQNAENKDGKYKTTVIDEIGGHHHMELARWPFFPNYAYKQIREILTTPDKGLKVMYDTNYHTQHTNEMRSEKTKEFKYPVVHAITKKGLGFWYSNTNKKGHFGIPKVLLNFNQFQYPYNDYKGHYGMSQLTFGLPIKSKREGAAIVRAINSEYFKTIIKATKWGAFQTDWRMFKYFKPDFFKGRGNSTRRVKNAKSKNKTKRKSKKIDN